MHIGRYEVEDLLGTGGFGNVYRARDPQIGREVAVKLLHETRCDAVNIARFEREARTVNAVRHAGVVEIFDFGVSEQGQHYFVMELLHGRSLAQVLDERGALPPTEALPLLAQVAEIVDAVHAHGTSHGDLEPANIMLLRDGRVKLIDFGLARLDGEVDRTATGDAFGSPLYMAPEQCRGARAGAASDRYAFGTVAYHVLTGSPPFTGESIAVALAHVGQAPRRPSRVRRGLTCAIDTGLVALLAKDAAARPSCLAAVVADMRRPTRRRAVTTTASILGVAALAGAVAIALRDPAPHPRAAFRLRHLRATAASELRTLSLGEDGSTEAAATYRSTFPDGRTLESNGTVTLVDRGGRRWLGLGELAEACQDNRSVALFAEQQLFVLDLAAGNGGPITAARGALGARWSPDCRRIVWGNHEGVHITEVRTAKTVALQLALAGPVRAQTPAAFLDARTLVYCRREPDDHVALVARALDRDAPERVLHVLPTETAGCTIDVANGRVAVGAFAFAGSLEIVDLQRVTKTVLQDASAAGLAFVDEEDVVATTHPVQSSALTAPPRDATSVVTRNTLQLGTDGSRTNLATCEGTLAMTRYRGALVHVVRKDQTYVLLAMGTCKPVREIALPAPGLWSPPARVEDRCFSTLLGDTKLVAYQVAPRIAHLAVISRENVAREGAPQPAFAIAPDGKHAVVQACGEPIAYLLDVQHPAATPTPIGGTTSKPLGQAVWLDESTFVVRTGDLDGTLVTRTVKGEEWPLVDDAADALAVSPSGTRVLFRRSERRHVIHLFEVER